MHYGWLFVLDGESNGEAFHPFKDKLLLSYSRYILFIDRMLILSPSSILSYVNNQIGYIGDKGCYSIGMAQYVLIAELFVIQRSP
jgi:hypothetical protein